jgi:hypothetical protein
MGDKIKMKNFKDFKNSWSVKGNEENISKASDMVSDTIKHTKLLDWIESKGYGVRYSYGQDFKDGADYEKMGQMGYIYTFYLYKTATDEQIKEYLEGLGDFENVDEVVEYFGDKIRKELEGNFTGVSFEPYELDSEGNLIFDENTKVVIESDDIDEPIHWFGLVPLNDSAINKRKICEFGLFRAQTELLKLIGSTRSIGFEDLSRNFSDLEYNISFGDPGIIINYMNLSNIHMKKNEDLELATQTQYMLYKTHKLINEISDGRTFFKIPTKIIEEFIRLEYSI